MTGGGWQYLAVFLVSAALSLFFTPLVLRFALWRDVYDHPGEHKAHADPVPYLGGLAIVGAFALTVGIAVIIRPPVSGAASSSSYSDWPSSSPSWGCSTISTG